MPLNPFLTIALQTAVVVTTLGFTPALSSLRPGALVIVALCTGHCISTSLGYFVRTPWASLAGGYSVMLLLHYVDIGLLTRWEFVDPSPTKSPKTLNSTWVARVRFGIWAAFNARCIGTPEQVYRIPEAVTCDRAAFLRRSAGIILLSYLGLDVLGSMGDPEVGSRFLIASRVPLFRRISEITTEEIVIRVFSGIAAGIGLLASQGGFYYLFAFTSVFARWSKPQDWPPFYGALSDAYSLRRLWSRVWHQSNSHKFRAISRFFARDVFRFQPGTLADRYAKVVMVFATSAFMHLLIDLSSGLSPSSSGAVQFFCTQAFGLMLEDLAVNAYSVILRGGGPSRNWTASRGERIFGFLWVASFLVWSFPAYLYPMLYRSNAGLNDSVVPVSVVGLLQGK
ncbi:hypothetical protein BO83DRAFT_403733 [Aspergillus eucalypticola CBS 122712]|uniref:Wax synthase domain-containing protein n=1 Tax=Aspergillus eucalypticola (strain CBS 122712 / IBT 29274) TaxID=1448314 RepID=A0A317UPZ5_ASPEC|nr:uncharacterized protein BO83DRAFT_403733 [Aspergillus eucalypticola CBS 122712]PWY62637.1 hypothetical protein BO83DRAFT_403733 [Aspergillus eucalypticola CBS 122712]